MQNIAKACRSKSISELERVVEEHRQHVSADPIVKVGSKWISVCVSVCVCVKCEI